jgi:hypothetical protein
MAKNYSRKLKDPRWQKKRLEIFQRDNFSCVKCKAAHKELHVHHTVYFKGHEPWEYNDELLETLCHECHEKEHELIPATESERKYEHFIIRKEEPGIIAAINIQINSLHEKLKEKLPDDLCDEILKNIIYLQKRRKEFQICQG